MKHLSQKEQQKVRKDLHLVEDAFQPRRLTRSRFCSR